MHHQLDVHRVPRNRQPFALYKYLTFAVVEGHIDGNGRFTVDILVVLDQQFYLVFDTVGIDGIIERNGPHDPAVFFVYGVDIEIQVLESSRKRLHGEIETGLVEFDTRPEYAGGKMDGIALTGKPV